MVARTQDFNIAVSSALCLGVFSADLYSDAYSSVATLKVQGLARARVGISFKPLAPLKYATCNLRSFRIQVRQMDGVTLEIAVRLLALAQNSVKSAVQQLISRIVLTHCFAFAGSSTWEGFAAMILP